jgi:hypothetical protein
VYYRNVTSVGTPITATAANSSATMSTATSPNFMYAQSFTYEANSIGQGLSAYNQTQRSTQTTLTQILPLLIGDAAGNGATQTFSATCATSSGWGGIILPLA